jgi:hypothetical protein
MGAVVPDGSERRSESLLDLLAKAVEIALGERLAPRLHQKDRTVAIDGDSRGAFRDTVEQAIAIGPIAREPFEERPPPIERGREEAPIKRQGRSGGGAPPWWARGRGIS